MKFTLAAILLTFSFSAMALQELECSKDSRPSDGDMHSVRVTAENGTYSVYYTYQPGGERLPSMPVPPTILNKKVASGLTCIGSKLDERIRQCSDDTMAQFLATTFVSRSYLQVLGKGNVTHVMNDTIEVQLRSPDFAQQTLVFEPKDCVLR